MAPKALCVMTFVVAAFLVLTLALSAQALSTTGSWSQITSEDGARVSWVYAISNIDVFLLDKPAFQPSYLRLTPSSTILAQFDFTKCSIAAGNLWPLAFEPLAPPIGGSHFLPPHMATPALTHLTVYCFGLTKTATGTGTEMNFTATLGPLGSPSSSTLVLSSSSEFTQTHSALLKWLPVFTASTSSVDDPQSHLPSIEAQVAGDDTEALVYADLIPNSIRVTARFAERTKTFLAMLLTKSWSPKFHFGLTNADMPIYFSLSAATVEFKCVKPASPSSFLNLPCGDCTPSRCVRDNTDGQADVRACVYLTPAKDPQNMSTCSFQWLCPSTSDVTTYSPCTAAEHLVCDPSVVCGSGLYQFRSGSEPVCYEMAKEQVVHDSNCSGFYKPFPAGILGTGARGLQCNSIADCGDGFTTFEPYMLDNHAGVMLDFEGPYPGFVASRVYALVQHFPPGNAYFHTNKMQQCPSELSVGHAPCYTSATTLVIAVVTGTELETLSAIDAALPLGAITSGPLPGTADPARLTSVHLYPISEYPFAMIGRNELKSMTLEQSMNVRLATTTQVQFVAVESSLFTGPLIAYVSTAGRLGADVEYDTLTLTAINANLVILNQLGLHVYEGAKPTDAFWPQKLSKMSSMKIKLNPSVTTLAIVAPMLSLQYSTSGPFNAVTLLFSLSRGSLETSPYSLHFRTPALDLSSTVPLNDLGASATRILSFGLVRRDNKPMDRSGIPQSLAPLLGFNSAMATNDIKSVGTTVVIRLTDRQAWQALPITATTLAAALNPVYPTADYAVSLDLSLKLQGAYFCRPSPSAPYDPCQSAPSSNCFVNMNPACKLDSTTDTHPDTCAFLATPQVSELSGCPIIQQFTVQKPSANVFDITLVNNSTDMSLAAKFIMTFSSNFDTSSAVFRYGATMNDANPTMTCTGTGTISCDLSHDILAKSHVFVHFADGAAGIKGYPTPTMALDVLRSDTSLVLGGGQTISLDPIKYLESSSPTTLINFAPASLGASKGYMSLSFRSYDVLFFGTSETFDSMEIELPTGVDSATLGNCQFFANWNDTTSAWIVATSHLTDAVDIKRLTASQLTLPITTGRGLNLNYLNLVYLTCELKSLPASSTASGLLSVRLVNSQSGHVARIRNSNTPSKDFPASYSSTDTSFFSAVDVVYSPQVGVSKTIPSDERDNVLAVVRGGLGNGVDAVIYEPDNANVFIPVLKFALPLFHIQTRMQESADFLLVSLNALPMDVTFNYVLPIKKSSVGSWMCGHDGSLYPCVTPPGCGISVPGERVCAYGVDNVVPMDSQYACAFAKKSIQGEGEYDKCAPAVMDVMYDPWSLPGSLGITLIFVDPLQLINSPSVTVTITKNVASRVFAWSSDTVCTGATCTYDAGTDSMTAVFASVSAGSAQVKLPVPVERYARSVQLTIDAKLTAKEGSILDGRAQKSAHYTLNNLNVFTFKSGVTPDGRFAYDDAEQTSGTLVATIADKTGLHATAGKFVSFIVESERYSLAGATCSIYSANLGDSSWLPQQTRLAATNDGAGTFTLADAPALTEIQSLTVYCTGVDVVTGSSPAGDMAVRLSGPNNTFVFDALLTSKLVNADGDMMQTSATFSSSATIHEIDVLGGSLPPGLLVNVTTSGLRVAIGATGGLSALLPVLYSQFEDLAQHLTSHTGSSFTLDTSDAPAIQGKWMCADGSTLSACAISPAGCGNAFGGSVVCAVRDSGVWMQAADQCPFNTAVPTPKPEYDMCDPKITAITPAFANNAFSFQYELDPTQFIEGKDAVLLLLPGNESPFDFATLPIVCSSPCSWDAAEKAVRVKLPALKAAGTATISAVPVRYAKKFEFTYDIVGADLVTTLVEGSVELVHTVDNLQVELSTVAVTAVFSGSSTTTGSLIVSLGAPDATTQLGSFSSAAVSSVTLTLPPSWDLSTGECKAVLRAPSSNTWIFAGDQLDTVRTDATFAFTVDMSISELSSLRLECSNVGAALASGSPITVAVVGASSAYLVEAKGTHALTVSPSDLVAAKPQFIGFEIAADTDTPDFASLATEIRELALNNRTDTDFAYEVVDATRTRITIGLKDSSTVYAKRMSTMTAMAANDFVMMLNSADLGQQFTLMQSRVGLQGVFKCPDPDSGDYIDCKIDNNCGISVQTPACRLANGEADATYGCAFDTKPAERDESGCGTWSCTNAVDAPVSCSDASLCTAGCTAAVPISIDVSKNEHLAAGPFKQTCFVDGAAADHGMFCPLSLRTPQTYAATCDAKSTCALHCAGLDGKLKSCSSGLSWAACDATCGAGKQARITKCSGETSLKIGDIIGAVPDSLCNAVTPAFDVERPCDGRGCTSYAWKCMVAGSPVDCDDSAGYSGCSGKCGAATETRAVVCTSVTSDGTFAGLETNESFCTARALKPASSRICTSTDCTGAVWKCYQRGGNPFSPVTCGDGGAVSCPVDKCHAAVSIARNVGCYDQETNARAAASKCNAAAKPDTTIVCEADTSGCVVDFTGAKCDTVTDHANAGRTCIPSAGTPSGVFRVGKCVDTTGTVVTGVCSEAQVRKQCVLPVCAGAETLTYAWATDKSSSLCQDGCKSFAPVTVTCVASGVGDPTEVDDSFCAAADKPLPYEACEPGVCASGSTCGADTPVFVGATKYSGIFAKCVCPAGFYGPLCDQTAELSLTFDRATSTASWTFDSAGAANAAYFLTFSVSLDDAPHSVSDGPLPVPDTGAMRLTYTAETADLVIVPADMNCDTDAGCSYTLAMSGVRHGFHTLHANFIGATAPSGGSTILEQIDCDGGSCGAHGSCDYETYACTCDEGYSGAQCEVAPCATAGCNVLASSCDFASDDSDVAQCVCDSADFTGAKCDALDGGCPQAESCAHGAVRIVFADDTGAAACGACQCSGNWAGELCDTCKLQCQNGGTVDVASGCSKCACTTAGVHGDTCELHHSVLTLNIANSTDTAWFFTETATSAEKSASLAAWSTTFVRSLAALSGNPAIPVAVASVAVVADKAGTKYMQLLVHYGSYTHGSSAQFETYAAIETLKTRAQVDRTTVGVRSHLSELSALAPLYMARGMGAFDPLCSANTDADVECPKGSLNSASFDDGGEPSSGSDTLSTKEKIAVGVCVGVGGVLLIALVLFALYKCGVLASYGAKKFDASAGGVEMTTTYDV